MVYEKLDVVADDLGKLCKVRRDGLVIKGVKFLPGKHEDLSLTPKTHASKLTWRCTPIMPAPEKQTQEALWGSLAQPAQPTCEFQASERACLKEIR